MPWYYISSEHDISICTVIPDSPELNGNRTLFNSESLVPLLATHTWFFNRSVPTYCSSWSGRIACSCVAADACFRYLWREYMPCFFLVSPWSVSSWRKLHHTRLSSVHLIFTSAFQWNALGWLIPGWTCSLPLVSLVWLYEEKCISALAPHLQPLLLAPVSQPQVLLWQCRAAAALGTKSSHWPVYPFLRKKTV